MTRRSFARSWPARPAHRARPHRPSLTVGTTTAFVALLWLTAPAAMSAAPPTTVASAPNAAPAVSAAARAASAAPALNRVNRSWVRCPQGAGSIAVAPRIAGALRQLLREGLQDGVPMCGDGWRSHRQQVQLRFQNCGVSTKAVYTWPAKWCTPPTARPGTSMHERGLAVDFRPLRGVTRAGMYAWLRANAPKYRLYQLPSENWHYSTTGG